MNRRDFFQRTIVAIVAGIAARYVPVRWKSKGII